MMKKSLQASCLIFSKKGGCYVIFCNFFQKKVCRNEKLALSLHSQNRWWIHLRARIRASHARHRGSNPLSTTTTKQEDVEFRHLFVFWSMAQIDLLPLGQKTKKAIYRLLAECLL